MLAYKVTSPLLSVAARASRPAGGRDRRVHHRREVELVWAQVDGGWYRVHDLSLGGLALDRPVEDPGIGSVIDGELHSKAGGRMLRCSFQATVVRLDADGARIGASFVPMDPEQIDGLLAITSAVEREYLRMRQAEQRREVLRRRMRRLAVIAAGMLGAVAAGYVAWTLR